MARGEPTRATEVLVLRRAARCRLACSSGLVAAATLRPATVARRPPIVECPATAHLAPVPPRPRLANAAALRQGDFCPRAMPRIWRAFVPNDWRFTAKRKSSPDRKRLPSRELHGDAALTTTVPPITVPGDERSRDLCPRGPHRLSHLDTNRLSRRARFVAGDASMVQRRGVEISHVSYGTMAIAASASRRWYGTATRGINRTPK